MSKEDIQEAFGEAEMLSRLTHPNIVRVREVFKTK
jgi:hypothetical protein